MLEIDQKIFSIIETLMKIGQVQYHADVYRLLGMRKQNYNSVKAKEASFTVIQISKFCTEYQINANHLFHDDRKVFLTKTAPTKKAN
jgi:hypothetical protein